MEENGLKHPFLVVVPPGLLGNWQNELRRWAPTLKVYLYHGDKQRRCIPDYQAADQEVLIFYEVNS